jgi:hypothetical protein
MVDADIAARGGRSLVDGMVSGSRQAIGDDNNYDGVYWIDNRCGMDFGFGSFPSQHREIMFDGQTRAASES